MKAKTLNTKDETQAIPYEKQPMYTFYERASEEIAKDRGDPSRLGAENLTVSGSERGGSGSLHAGGCPST